MLVYEFAKSRGAIHFHSCSTASGDMYDRIDQRLARCGLDIADLVQGLDATIRSMREAAPGIGSDPLAKGKYKEAIKAWQDFLCRADEGKQVWAEYEHNVNERTQALSSRLTKVMDSHFSVSAVHIGVAPCDWVKPGGANNSDHRTTHSLMHTKEDVVDKAELRQPKFTREPELFDRRVNITNHCGSHSCSDYCWRTVTCDVKYDPENHKEGGGTKASSKISRPLTERKKRRLRSSFVGWDSETK
jgi:hypothetical protein